jgi:PAS domain S-box-containing protein
VGDIRTFERRRGKGGSPEAIEGGQIEILDYSQWYTKSGRFNAEDVLQGWAEKEKQALASGFDGLRLTGNTFWLEQKDWQDFADYEAEINRVIGSYRMLAICTYSLDKCTPSEIIDVVSNHEFALIRREHKWEIIESAKHKETERQLRNSELKLRTLIENAPIGIYVNDLEGRFIYGNENAEKIVGRSKDEFIGRNFLDLDILGPEDVEKAKILQGLNREGKHTGPDEFILNRKDGTQRTLEVSTVVVDFEGKKAVLGMVQDVTEHRQAEHGLRAEKEFTETALNAQADTFFVFEAATGKAVRWNEAFKKVSGYSDDQIRSMKAPDSYYSEEDLKKAKAATEKILKGEAASVKLSLITRNGRSIPTEYTASLIRDDSGNPKYIIAVGRDITERKRAAEALRESEEKYRAIFEQAADSIVLVDAETGKFVDFNNKTCENLGYSREEFERLEIADIDVCESEQRVLQHAKKVVTEGADTFETKMRTKGGEIRDVLVSARGISLRGRRFISSVWRDVTERKQAEQALRESEEKFRNLAEQSPNMIFINRGGRIAYANARCEEATGYTRDEFSSPDFDFLTVIAPESRDAIKENYRRHLKGEDVEPVEYALVTKTGDRIDAILTTKLIQYEGENAILGTVTDITEQRKAQEALKRSEERYALAQQAANVGSWDWNIPTGELTWSEQIEPMFGFGNGEFAGTYEAFLECVHPDDRQHVIDSVNACMETEQDYSIEHRIVWPDGSSRWLSEKGDVIHDEAGNAIRMVGVVQDITERRTAEEQLLLGSSILEIINQKAKGQDTIRRILQLVKDFTGFDAVGIRLREEDDYPYFEVNGFSQDFVSKENYLCAHNESGEVVHDSQGRPVLECMCGNVILGRTDPDATFFTEGGSFWTNSTTDLLASTSEKERLTHTRNHCNRAGYESVALIPLRSGPEIVGLLQLNDHRKERFATEMIRFFERIGDSIGIALARIKAEEDIKNLAKFPSENPYPVLRITKDGTVLYTNSAGFQLLADWGSGVDEHVPQHWHQYISRILAADQPEELETTCADRIFSLTITPVVDAGYVNVYGTDITERKQAEEDLREYRQHLEELVRARTAELTATNEQLRREIEQRRNLEKEILEVSEREKRSIGQELHDSIGQQLTGVAFMTKVLEQKLAARSPSEAVDVTEIAKLVNQAMDLTRGLAKGLHPVDLDADSLMSALRELAGSTENLFGISCTFKCDQPVLVEDAQVAVNIYRIAQEAVTNAIRHSKAKNIQLQLHLGDGQASLTVASDGLDFPEDVKARGSGMGLQIMNHRAEMIDGSLDVCRGDQGGTMVTCVFPNKKPGQ